MSYATLKPKRSIYEIQDSLFNQKKNTPEKSAALQVPGGLIYLDVI